MIITWVAIIVAGLLEPCWVYTMEKSENFHNMKWGVLTAVLMVVDIFLLSITMEPLGAGTAYAIWTGIGSIFTLIMGIVMFKDPLNWHRILFIMLIMAGIVGIHLTTGVA